MTYRGHVENGVIVLDEPAELPEGAPVRVELAEKGSRPTLADRLRDVIGIGDVDLVFHGDALRRMVGRDDHPETKTLMWRADAGDVPVPEAAPQSASDSSPEAPTRHATSLESLFQGGADYSRVSSVDSSVLMTGMLPRGGQDPAELARRLHASYEIAQATAETQQNQDQAQS